MAATKRKAVLGRRRPVADYAPAAPSRSGVSVMIPLSPETVAAVQEHFETGRKLYGMLADIATIDAGDLIATVKKAAAALERDHAKITAAIRARKRRLKA